MSPTFLLHPPFQSTMFCKGLVGMYFGATTHLVKGTESASIGRNIKHFTPCVHLGIKNQQLEEQIIQLNAQQQDAHNIHNFLENFAH